MNLLFQNQAFMSRLGSLTAPETRTLLTKYFEKVIDLREDERKKSLECSTLEVSHVTSRHVTSCHVTSRHVS